MINYPPPYTIMKNVINIINFIRGCEPRSVKDLPEPVRNQIELHRKHGLPGTFLFQYDALTPEFTGLFENAPDGLEYGLWLEIMQPLVEACGLKWRGRFPWDWHSDVGFTVGYPVEERKALADEAMRKFKEVFGYYPKSVGSWTIDAVTLAYMSDKYGVDAFCDCKEQWGTDGYTLWGGYPGGGYYPSRRNMLSPERDESDKINTPMFRMLGADPIYQYDFGMDVSSGLTDCQGVVTLEPVYTGHTGGGGVPKWVDWYLSETFAGRGLSLAYTQMGQENSFGWENMKNGLIYQYAEAEKLREAGKVEVLTLGETGRRFRESYENTPPVTLTALSDWAGSGHKSVWYACRDYRANIMVTGNKLRFRDIYLFGRSDEIYLDHVCESELQTFETAPVMDGARFTGRGILAGIYPKTPEGEDIVFDDIEYSEDEAAGTAMIALKGGNCCGMTITMTESGIDVACKSEFRLDYVADFGGRYMPRVSGRGGRVGFEYGGNKYGFVLTAGRVSGASAVSENGRVSADLRRAK